MIHGVHEDLATFALRRFDLSSPHVGPVGYLCFHQGEILSKEIMVIYHTVVTSQVDTQRIFQPHVGGKGGKHTSQKASRFDLKLFKQKKFLALLIEHLTMSWLQKKFGFASFTQFHTNKGRCRSST